MTGQARVVAVISVGGVAGALARYAIGRAFPAAASGFPWGTFGINVVGCLLIGVLMVFVAERWSGRPLIRPFLGVGVLGGFTTFSTYAVDFVRLTDADATGTAVAYLLGTFVAAVVAVYVGGAATRWALRPRERSGE